MKTNNTTTDRVRFNALVIMYNDNGSDNGGTRLKLEEVTLETMIKGFLSKLGRWLYTKTYTTESCEKIGDNEWKTTIKCSGYTFNLVVKPDIVLKPDWWED